MTDLTERLRKRADEDAKCAENSKVVADLLRPQLDAFEANEDHGNIYAIRMAVDHRDSVKRDGQYAADLREAATTLETLTQENARLRELCDAACSNAETALDFLAKAGRPELAKIQAIYVANLRKALGGGDE